MRFYRMTIALWLLAAGFGPALSADSLSDLKKALGQIPETALATPDPMPIVFLDVKSLARTDNGTVTGAALRRLSLADSIRPLESLAYGVGEGWTQKAGTAFGDITYFAAFGQLPARVSYWGLADAKAADALLDRLKNSKFKEVSAAPRMLANGKPRMINLLSREPDNPWLGPLGQTSFVMAHDNAVIQSSAPEDLRQIVDMKRSAAENPAVAILLDGLAGAKLMQDSDIVQAMIVTPLFGLPTADPADVLLAGPGGMQAAKKKIEAKVDAGRKGIPAYLAGVLADIQRKDGATLVVSLAYSDCSTAELAVATMKARLSKTMGFVRMTGETVPTENGACAAVVGVVAHQLLLDAHSRHADRDFNLLQIGTPE